MEASEFRSFYDMISSAKDVKLKLNVPDTIFFKIDGTVSNWVTTNKDGFVSRRPEEKWTLAEARAFLLSSSKMTSDEGIEYICLERTCPSGTGNTHKALQHMRRDVNEPRLLEQEQFNTAIRFLEHSQTILQGEILRNVNEQKYHGKAIYALQEYIQPLDDARFVTSYSDHDGDIRCDTYMTSFSRRYASEGASQPDIQNDAPAPFSRQLRRTMNLIIDFLYRVHGIKVQGIVCEFICDYLQKVYFHSIISFVVHESIPRPAPSLGIPKGTVVDKESSAHQRLITRYPSGKISQAALTPRPPSGNRRGPMLATPPTSPPPSNTPTAKISPPFSNARDEPFNRGAMTARARLQRVPSNMSPSPQPLSRYPSTTLAPAERISQPMRQSAASVFLAASSLGLQMAAHISHQTDSSMPISPSPQLRKDTPQNLLKSIAEGNVSDVVAAIGSENFSFTPEVREKLIGALRSERGSDYIRKHPKYLSPELMTDEFAQDRKKLEAALSGLEGSTPVIQKVISDVLMKKFGNSGDAPIVTDHEEGILRMEETIRALTDVIVRLRAEMGYVRQKNEEITNQCQSTKMSNGDLSNRLAATRKELDDLNESIGNSIQTLTNERDELRYQISRKDKVIADMIRRMESQDELAKIQNDEILREERRLQLFNDSHYIPLDIDDILAEDNERERTMHNIQKFLYAHEVTIQQIFQHYAADYGDLHSAFTMSLIQFWRFSKDCHLHTIDLPLSKIDLFFVRSNLDRSEAGHINKDPHNPEHSLLYHEFIEGIIRIAHARYVHIAALEGRVERLFTTKIFPHAGCKRVERFRNMLNEPKVVEIIKQQSRNLFRIFKLYCDEKFDESERGKSTMIIQQFMLLLRDCNIIDEKLSHNAVANAFVLSLCEDPAISGQSQYEYSPHEMVFGEFIECLARCSIVKYSDGHIPFHRKVEMFVESINLGNLRLPKRKKLGPRALLNLVTGD